VPYWAVIIVILVLVVGYYLLSQQGRERRREKVGVDFAKTPGFYANQSYTDVQGESAIGIDDRGRRIAVARKHAQPRTRVYSFAHIVSAEVLQDDKVLAFIGRDGGAGATAGARGAADVGARGRTDVADAGGGPAAGPAGEDSAKRFSGLFGSTGDRPGVTGLPRFTPIMGQLSRVAVRVVFSNGDAEDPVLLRFYEGKPINADGVVGERAFGEARVLLGSLDVAIKRAGSPPKGPATPKTPVR
jgi:hypothetical protein